MSVSGEGGKEKLMTLINEFHDNVINEHISSDTTTEEEDEHESTTTNPTKLRKQLSSELSHDRAFKPVSSPQENYKTMSSKETSSRSHPAPRLAQSRARATSGFFAKSTLDPECGEMMRPSLILGLLYFKRPLSVTTCREILTDRLVVEFQRFRSKVIMEKNEIFFQELPLDSIDMHYHCHEVNSQGWTQKDLDMFLSTLYKENKPSCAPLWMFYVLNDLADGRSCLVANIDHCIGDGITMVQVLMSLLDDNHSNNNFLSTTVPKTSSSPKKISTDNSQAGINKKKTTTHKQSSRISLAEKVYVFLRGVVLGIVGPLLPGDPPNMLKIKDPRVPGQERTCSFGEKISLDKVKEVKNKFRGATVNDILSAVLNMAVKRYYEKECPGFLSSHPKVRALFPINMRKKGVDARVSLGNCFSTGVFQFLFNYESRVDLVWKVKRQVDLIKISPQPLVELFFLQSLFPLLSGKAITDLTLSTFGKFTMSLSNVPGPQSPAFFGGQEIDDLSFVACSPIGLYCGLLSYNGKVSCGLCSDPSAEPEPDKVTRYWKEEFDALYDEVMAFDGDIPPPKLGVWERHKFTMSFVVILSFSLSYFYSWFM